MLNIFNTVTSFTKYNVMIFFAKILTHCKSHHYFQFTAVALIMMTMVSKYSSIAHTKKKMDCVGSYSLPSEQTAS